MSKYSDAEKAAAETYLNSRPAAELRRACTRLLLDNPELDKLDKISREAMQLAMISEAMAYVLASIAGDSAIQRYQIAIEILSNSTSHANHVADRVQTQVLEDIIGSLLKTAKDKDHAKHQRKAEKDDGSSSAQSGVCKEGGHTH